jgi:phospholipase/carboxylesterase
LLRANTRFVLPAAPLPEGPGRAWWRLGAGPSYLRAAEDLQAATSVAPNPEIDGSRRHVLNVIRIARQHYEPSSLALVGFSQGGMLALDVALQPASVVSRVAVLSGALLNETAPLLQVERSRAPAVLLAHGERDTRVPFEAARTARQALQLQGLPVTWFPFDAGHTISADVVRALSDFLFSPNAASP